ncbi:hypothetical protein CspeluHIS016_0306610 [Cutaneotrichosporon spelunceum]|uniref:Major facilitator superfamily (MFS) profile domain-containing protein n=1 Tax=Cutaneotrichosporon spelunceum TaxID=1672016 RepID=A0AAD3TUM3_9TREE|nr:hypothetical protein CspeluHIS016_0306610 [Cutaneotrichosporon spelunceum]
MSDAIKKVDVEFGEVEVHEKARSSIHGPIEIDEGYTPAQIRSVTRKVDRRLIPVLSLLYCISFIDRTNLSLARAANGQAMNKELDLLGGNNRYGLATLIFFVPYIIFEIPSQLGLRAFGARWWLGLACFFWGLVMMCFGFIQTWQALVGLRAVLGLFECALFPGATYLISCWYPRRQMATRTTFFYVLSVVVCGLSATLAYGISKLHGRGGYSGWRWIFIINGIMTMVIAGVGMIFIVDFPDRAKFLQSDEKELIETRIQRDRSDAEPDAMTLQKFWSYVCDGKLWIFAYIFCTSGTSTYALSYFLPRILLQMGFTGFKSVILVAPPYVWVPIPAMATAILADRYQQRALAISLNSLQVIIGTCMYSKLSSSHLAARYAGVFIAVGGSNANMPLAISWAQTAIRRQSKRGYTSAIVVAFGGISGIIAGVSFIEKEADQGYPTGIHITLAMTAASILCCLGLWVYFRLENRRADRDGKVLEGHPDFRYQT